MSSPRLLFDVLQNRFSEALSHIHCSGAVDGNAVRRIEAFDAVGDASVSGADGDEVLRLARRNKHLIAVRDENGGRRAELHHRFDVRAVLIEYLQALVSAVTHPDA